MKSNEGLIEKHQRLENIALQLVEVIEGHELNILDFFELMKITEKKVLKSTKVCP